MIQKWAFDKTLTELPPGTTDNPPQDPQLAKAVELLKKALDKASADRQAQGGK